MTKVVKTHGKYQWTAHISQARTGREGTLRVSLLFWVAAGPPRRHIDVGDLSLGSRPFAPYSRSSAANNNEYGQNSNIFYSIVSR
jgi:hypothetical protein